MSPLLVSVLLAARFLGAQDPVVPGAPAVKAPAPAEAPATRQHRRRRSRRNRATSPATGAAPSTAPPAPQRPAAASPSAPAPSATAPANAAGPTQEAAAEQLAQAEARYRSALATTPGIAAYHESLALVLERENRLPEALASHEQAVKLDSMSFRGRAGLGTLLLRLGRSAEAVPHLRAAAAIDRTSIETRKSLAAALLALGQRDAALVALREARQLDSSDSDIERSLKQAEATAPGKDRLNDGSAIVDHPVGRAIRRGLEWTFGLVLVAASLALLVPMLSGAVMGLVRRAGPRREVAA
jgi:tetratricopeptide (TPR) repeat protein